MKVTYAPIVQSASGRMGGIVATRWRGIDIMRRFVPPAQPRTAPQIDVRNRFRNANRLYGVAPLNCRNSWDNYSAQRPAIARNGMIAAMGAIPNTDTDIANLIPIFQDVSAPSVDEFTGTGGSGTVTFTRPDVTLPTGYSATMFLSFGIGNFDPQEAQLVSSLSWDEESAAFTPTGAEVPPPLTLTPGDYLVGVSLISTRDNDPSRPLLGITALDIVTVTA